MDRTQISALIDKAYAARKAGDLDALVRMFGPDGVFRVAGAPELFPAAVSARGEAQIRDSIRKLVDTYKFMEIEPLDLIIEGDKAARRWRAKVKHAKSGDVREIEASDIWTFKDGRVASLIQFVDTALVADMAKGKGAERGAFREQPSRTAPPAGRPH